MELMHLVSRQFASTGTAYNTDRICTRQKSYKTVHVYKTFNKIANFGMLIAPKCVWQAPRSAGGNYSAPQISYTLLGGDEGGKEKERVGNKQGGKGEVKE